MEIGLCGKPRWSRLVQFASGLLLLAAASQVHSDTITNGIVQPGAVSVGFLPPESITISNGVAQSGAVSVKFPAPTSATVINGVTQSGAVSVKFPAPTSATVSNGVTQSGAVSVKFPVPTSATVINGVTHSGAVSVKFPTPSSATVSNGVVHSGAVSVLFKSPAGLWNMDGDWRDATVNGNHGTPSGEASFDADGRAGSAGLFDGSGDYLSMGTSSILRPVEAFSLETWIKINPSRTGSLYVAGNSNETSMTGYGLVVLDGGTVQLKKGNGSWLSIDSTTALTPGLWYYVAGTYDGSRLKVYINATLENDVAATGSITYANPFRIGSHGGASGPRDFFGSIDELSIYNRSLPAQEIADHYASIRLDIVPPEAPTVSAVAPLTGNPAQILSGTKESDTSIWVNGTEITPHDAATTWQGTYTLRSGFNTLDIKAVDEVDNQSPSVILSVTLDDKAPQIGSSAPANNSDTALTVSAVTINLIDEYSAIDLAASLAEAKVKVASEQDIAGVWTPSGEGTLTFVPDAPFPENTYTVIIHPADALGNTGTQQVVFTNHDISPPSTTISLSGTLGGDGWFSTPVLVTLSADDGAAGSGIDRTEYRADSGTWITYESPFVLNVDGITTVSYRSTDLRGNTEATKTGQVMINQAGVVGLWQMENDWLDSSYFSNDGLPANGATFSRAAKIGEYSGSFDGTDDYASGSVINLPLGNSPRTIMAWVKTDTVTADAALFHYGAAIGTSPPSNFTLYVTSGMKAAIGNGYGLGAVVGTSNVADGQWHLLAGTYQNNTATISVDGVVENSTTITTPNTASGNFRIGSFLGGTGFFHGLIDDVVVYNRVLSPEEIRDYYEKASMQRPTVDPVQSPTASQSIVLSGTKATGTSILVNGIEIVPLDTVLTWQGTCELVSGLNTLNITAKSSAGYQSQPITVSVVMDNTPPTISSSTPANSAFVNSLITAVTIQLADALTAVDLAATTSGASVKNSVGDTIPGAWGTSGEDVIVFTPFAPFGEGSYTVAINPTDTVGNTTTGQITFMYDVSAPPVPTINAPSSPTRNASQSIAGTKTVDTTAVIVTSSTATISAVTYPTTTSWVATVSNLQQGSNTIAAAARDAAGNQSVGISAEIVYDLTPPVVATVDAVQSPTKNSTVTLAGTKEADTDLYLNGTKAATVFAETTWSYSPNLSEGLNTFSIYCKDAAGNQGATLTVQIVRDSTPPRIASSVPGANGRVSQAQTIEVTFADDNSTVDLDASLVGATLKNSSNAVVSGTWSALNGHAVFTPSSPLTDSVYTVAVSPMDALGNKGASSFSFTVDTVPPIVQSFVMSPTSPHKAEVVTFTIVFNKAMATSTPPVVSFGAAVPYTQTALAGGTWSDTKTWRGSYSFATNTGDGTYLVRISNAQDSLGNLVVPVEMGSFVVDTVPPGQPVVNTVTSPTKTASQTISGTKPADTSLVVNGMVRVGLNASSTWSYSYPLLEGLNNISIVARDAADNDSPVATATIVLDTKPPVFTIDNYQTPASSASQLVSGTREPGSIVKLNNGQIIGADDQSSTWSYTLTLIQGISNHFVFTATDALNNTTTKSLEILYDVSPPAALSAGVLAVDGRGKGTEIALSWSSYLEASDVAYYRVFMSNAAFNDATGRSPVTTTNKGIKSFKVTGLTQGSTYFFGVVPVDASGNFDSLVNSISGVPTDTVAPEEVAFKTVTAGYDGTNGNFITLMWTPSANSSSDLADQIVYFDGGVGYDDGTPLGATPATFTKSGLNDATRYKFKISVKDNSGHESNGVLTEAVTRLGNPATLTATPGNTKVSLSWAAVSSPYLKQYNLYRIDADQQQTDASNMTLVTTVVPSKTSYVDTGRTNGVTYQYAVTTLNTFGAERTAVSSVSAKPRMDETGPVVGSLNIANGQVINSPAAITASATDAESFMGRLELSIDNELVKSQTGASLSYLYDPTATTDGNHTLELSAYDQHDNLTEVTRQFIVSLAPPAAPTITGHAVVQTTPKYLVNLSGTAALSTSVTLRLNNTVLSTTPPGTGTFSFADVELAEGSNLISVKAAHRGGESPYSPDYTINVDTGAPPSPLNFASQVLTGGAIRLTWQNGTGEVPSGYNLYRGSATFSAKSSPGVTKLNSTQIAYLLKEYTPADDSLGYYAVTALDSAGNESEISNLVAVSSDRLAPTLTAIEYRYYDRSGNETYPATVAGIGSVKVFITVSKILKELPFFSLEPAEGSPIVLSMKKIDDLHYEGTFDVTLLSPHGGTTYKFSGKDLTGNRGNSQGTGLRIDIHGPVAAVQAPLTLLQITAVPVEISVVFDEPSVSVPVIALKSSSGETAQVTDLLSSDSGIHWTGNVNVSALAEGQAEFLLNDATDELGNIGTSVSSGKTILIYRDAVPPPSVAAGLTAKSGKAGLVTLTWNPVEGASAYNLYRRAESETASELIKTGMAGSPTQDTPPADGMYFYSISSIGLLQSESQVSAEVQGLSDRNGPAAPADLLLGLDGSGVTAIWSAVTDPQPNVKYNLYRSGGQVTTTAGLTPVVKVSIAKAVDTAPVQSKRFYAVTALDSLGNEGPLSETREITFPVSPVRNLNLSKVDSAAPYITWLAPSDGTIQGYYIYRNGNRITQAPVATLSYTDGYYSGGTVTYGISAVNDLGNEGPIKELVLPDLSIDIKEGTILKAGLLETVPVILSSNTDLSIDTIELKVGTAPSSQLQGPFALATNTTLQLEKVVASAFDALSPTAVLTSASWSPSPGVSVKITKTSSAEVTGASTALEIFSDPLVKGTDVKVRLKINNLGSGQMEFVTSENSGITKKLKIILKDEDGNVLSTGYLDQRVGNAIVNTGTYAVARLEPNSSLLTEPVNLSIPASAPYSVILEAMIDSTYYHYNKPDQVVAPGMRQSMESAISDSAYRAEAAPEHDYYQKAQPVLITGQAISNSTGSPVANVPVKLGISVRGFDRYNTVTTDADGNFSYTFTPGSTEAGLYSVWAVHPDVKDRSIQSTFAIAGLGVTPAYATVKMLRDHTIDVPLSLINYGGAPFTSLQFETQSSQGITTTVLNTGDNILSVNEKAKVTLRLTSSSTAPSTCYANLFARTAEGSEIRFDATISLVSAIPIITTSPSLIDTGMVRGNQKIETFTIRNVGEETLKNAKLVGPSTAWMTLAVDKTLGDILPGASMPVGVILNPSETLAQGVYDDTLVISSDNHIPYTYHIQVTVTSSAVGNVLVDVLDELMEDVPGANITLQHQLLTELIYSKKTLADGTVMLYDIPEGRYSYNISAPGHTSSSGSFVVYPGLTTTVPIALEVTLVQVEWSVTPVVIEDRYEIKVTTTFETNVPTPVLVIEPGGITVPELAPGQVFNGEFMASNYGLVALNNVTIAFPSSFGEYDVELLATLPSTLNAMQKVTVPYRITRRRSTASLADPRPDSLLTLIEEVKGYGGNPCYANFAILVSGKTIICPNTGRAKEVTKSSSYTVMTPVPGSVCGVGAGSAPVGGGSGSTGGGGLYIGGIVPGQSGGGWLPGGVPAVIDSASDSCGSEPPVCTGNDCPKICSMSVVHLNNGLYEDSSSDLDMEISGFSLKFDTHYVSRWVPVGKILSDPCSLIVSVNGGSNSSSSTTTATSKSIKQPMCGTDSGVKPPQAYGWTSSLFGMVKLVKGGIGYFNGEGKVIFFTRDEATGFIKPSDGAEKYVAEEGITVIPIETGFRIKDKSSLIKTFEGVGIYRLTSIQNETGAILTFNYQPGFNESSGVRDYSKDRLVSISDDSDVVVMTFSYDTNGYISEVADMDGRTIRYQADSAGRLLRVEGIGGEVRTYDYTTRNNTHLLSRKVDTEGNEVLIEYKPGALEVVKVTAAEGAFVQQFSYDFPNRIAYYTDPNGTTFTYDISPEGKTAGIQLGTDILQKTAQYDNGRRAIKTDEAGNTQEIRYNERFDPVSITDGEGKVTTFIYNEQWKISQVTDPLGNTTKFGYDVKSQLKIVTYPDGMIMELERDDRGNITKQSKSKGAESQVYTYSYDGRGHVVEMTDPLGSVTAYGYDLYGHMKSMTDANGNTYQITADIHGRLLTAEDPLGNKWTLTYDKNGNVLSVTDGLNRTTIYSYSSKGRVSSKTDPAGVRTEYGYDAIGNLVKVTEGAGTAQQRITNAIYDNRSRLASVTDPEGNTTTYEYPEAGCSVCGGSTGSPNKITDPLGNMTNFSFDKNGKIAGFIDPLGNISQLGRNANGKVASLTDANGNVTSYQYDAMGRIVKQTGADYGEILFAYDLSGNLTTLTDQKGNTTTFSYDLAGRKTKETRPMGQAIEYTYYGNDLLKTVKDGAGRLSTYTYDTANRLSKIAYAGNRSDTFVYDAVGNMIAYQNDGVSGTIAYDAMNRKLSETLNFGVFSKTYSYTYDMFGNKATIASPEDTTYTYTYGKNNEATSIFFDEKTIGLVYQANRLVKTILPNGVSTDYQYDANSWMSSITTKQGTISYLDKKYAYDKVGNINSITDHSAVITDYTYDPTYQLTDASSAERTEGYAYDEVGNRLISSSSDQPAAISYVHNNNNELASAGAATYQYDGSGNTLQRNESGQITKFFYSTSNRLERVELPGGEIVTYDYDPFGRRIKKDVNGQASYYVYADEGLIGEYTATGDLLKGYGYIPDSVWGTNPVFMLDNGSYYWYINDHLGTPQKLVDEAGTVVWAADYKAFGEATVTTATVTNNLRFPGQYYDAETELHYNWMRYYDPGTGRYTQVDPIGFEGGDENLYRYVAGNPKNGIDPDGLLLNFVIGAGVGAGTDIFWQMVVEGRSWECVDGKRAVIAGVAGAIGGEIVGKLLGKLATKGVESFFKGTRYSAKVLKQMKAGPGEFHSFPEAVRAFESAGNVRPVRGGDGIVRQMLEIPGSYRTPGPPGGAWENGVFQFIKETDGSISHRLFVSH